MMRHPGSCAAIGRSPITQLGPAWLPQRLFNGEYDPGMSDKKARITVTIDPHLTAYAEGLVATGKAPSVSAVINDALQEKAEHDHRARRAWDAAAAKSDPEKGARMAAHVDRQLARL